MVLELIIIGGVVWYYADKHQKKKKAKLAAAKAATNNNNDPTFYPQGPPPSKGNAEGGYLPTYRDEPSPPIYEHGQPRVVPDQAPLPTYAESEVGSEKRAKAGVNEKQRIGV